MHPEVKRYVDEKIEELFALLEEHFEQEISRRSDIVMKGGRAIVFELNEELYEITPHMPDKRNIVYFVVNDVIKMPGKVFIDGTRLRSVHGSRFTMAWSTEEGEYEFYIDQTKLPNAELKELFIQLF